MERHFEGVYNICSISSPFLSFNLLRVFKRVFKRREERKEKKEQRKRKKNEQIFQEKTYKLRWEVLHGDF